MNRNLFFKGIAVISLLSTYTAFAEVNDKNFNAMMEKYLATDVGQEKIAKTVEGYFRKQQESAKKEQQARAMAETEEQFKNPVKIDAGNSPSRGPAGAKVTIIEFSDFQCPYCSRGAKTMEEVLKAYPNDVKVVFKNLPLDFHKDAVPAAKAAYAAGKQGKFWEMHDALFANQANLGDALYLEHAKKLGLNIEQFKKDSSSDEAAKAVAADTELGKKNGIQGTPGFFVNGVAVKGAYPFEHFKGIIDRWLTGKSATASADTQKAG